MDKEAASASPRGAAPFFVGVRSGAEIGFALLVATSESIGPGYHVSLSGGRCCSINAAQCDVTDLVSRIADSVHIPSRLARDQPPAAALGRIQADAPKKATIKPIFNSKFATCRPCFCVHVILP